MENLISNLNEIADRIQDDDLAKILRGVAVSIQNEYGDIERELKSVEDELSDVSEDLEESETNENDLANKVEELESKIEDLQEENPTSLTDLEKLELWQSYRDKFTWAELNNVFKLMAESKKKRGKLAENFLESPEAYPQQY